MTDRRHEVLLGLGAVAVSLLAWGWLRVERFAAERELDAREAQLRELAGLRRTAARNGLGRDTDMAPLSGLFTGYEVVVAELATGTCLTLRRASTPERP